MRLDMFSPSLRRSRLARGVVAAIVLSAVLLPGSRGQVRAQQPAEDVDSESPSASDKPARGFALIRGRGYNSIHRVLVNTRIVLRDLRSGTATATEFTTGAGPGGRSSC